MDKQLQLFLLPYAGGSAFSFYKVNRFLDARIEAIPIEYAGRGFRGNEPLISNYLDCQKDVTSQINKSRNESLPYALLGYSFGSVLSYDLVRNRLINGGFPKQIFFCAEGSLKKLSEDNKKTNYIEQELFEQIKQLGGFSKNLLKNPDVLQEVYSLIKNDFCAYKEFEYYQSQMDIDISIIYSPADFSAVSIEDWEDVTTKKIDYYKLGDNHFFINQKYKELSEIINRKLNIYLE